MPTTRSKSAAQSQSSDPIQQAETPGSSSTLEILTNNISDSTPVCFWKPHEEYGFLGQWYKSVFQDPETGFFFHTAEQYMMHQKAVLFGDTKIALALLEVPDDPKAQKALGRKVANFDAELWDAKKLEIVTRGSFLKFIACPADPDDKFVYPAGKQGKEISLAELLLATGDRELVETSALDRIWGVGYSQSKALQISRDKWGQNLLGIALMAARKQIREIKEKTECSKSMLQTR